MLFMLGHPLLRSRAQIRAKETESFQKVRLTPRGMWDSPRKITKTRLRCMKNGGQRRRPALTTQDAKNMLREQGRTLLPRA